MIRAGAWAYRFGSSGAERSMSHPSVAVVIPCYNHGAFVADAVRSCLAQRDADVRVVIVDDGSDDGKTPRACDRLAGERVVVIHQENRGLPAARNRGMRECRSDYLVFLDADDWLEATFISALHGALSAARLDERGANVSHAFCQERLVDLGTGIWRVPEWDPILLMVTNLHPVTALVRRECMEQVGGFDESMTGGYEDWDLWLKFVERGWRGVRVAEPLFVWRRHSPETMVMQVIHNHEALYRRIIANHQGLYDRHAHELLVKMNTMMRKFDVNWIDETGIPIPLRALWKVRDDYEAMLAVRAHHALHRAVRALPGPMRRAARWSMDAVKRACRRGDRRSQ